MIIFKYFILFYFNLGTHSELHSAVQFFSPDFLRVEEETQGTVPGQKDKDLSKNKTKEKHKTRKQDKTKTLLLQH